MPTHSKQLTRMLLRFSIVTALMAAILSLVLSINELWSDEIEPFSLENHPFVLPQPSDSRSPCPALNTLANHGFLPHSGVGISRSDYIRAMREGYHLSTPLAVFLTYSGHVLLSQYSQISLFDLARHNYIEHNASLGHLDALRTQEYAPCRANRHLIDELISASSDGKVMNMHDFAVARVNREDAYNVSLDALHEEIAHGEMSMVLGIFGKGNDTVPVPWIQEWWLNERFPDDFAPTQQQTLWKTVKDSQEIRKMMREIRAKKRDA
ncbi:Cloroperoxidase [Wolfiporia cocos MD-104 SS10]|uniref:Cloroperoxidase n=1 Tax=Wolfiporia cocos (strain MD-104) TaxID=742152 RepID=A0A2H3JPE0_WOLCO|nr:Cloroperoxidase [Wolfiporia cocos MD-104 SS10]